MNESTCDEHKILLDSKQTIVCRFFFSSGTKKTPKTYLAEIHRNDRPIIVNVRQSSRMQYLNMSEN